MVISIIEKLRIKEGNTLLMMNAPGDFSKSIGKLPTGARIVTTGKIYDQVHWFVLNKAQVEQEWSRMMKLLKENIIVWVYYPKKSSKIQTDLTRDKGWDRLLNEDDKLTRINLISFDDTWSAFGFRVKTGTDRKKDRQPKQREIFNWGDPATKEIKLPEDLSMAFKKTKLPHPTLIRSPLQIKKNTSNGS